MSLLGVVWVAPEDAVAKSGDVTICHVPPGNPRNAHTIVINPSSGVVPGTYFIEVIPTAGFNVTASDVGADDALDRDFDGDTFTSPIFNAVTSTFDFDCGSTTSGGF